MSVSFRASVIGTEHFVKESEARRFCREHVVISIRDLDAIRDIAKQHGFLDELKKLNVKIAALEPDF